MEQTVYGQYLRDFYESNSVEEWKNFLEPFNYHYHLGIEGVSENIFENAIYENVFPFIADGSKVLDCGAGWGAPAEMLTLQKNCDVTCVTNSPSQVSFIQKNRKDIKVLEQDLNIFKSTLHYDVALFYESFSNVEDSKENELLESISFSADNILIIDYISKLTVNYHDSDFFMNFNTLDELYQKITNAGFEIQHCQELSEKYFLDSYQYWKPQFNLINPLKGNLATLSNTMEYIMSNFTQNMKNVGLVCIHASKKL